MGFDAEPAVKECLVAAEAGEEAAGGGGGGDRGGWGGGGREAGGEGGDGGGGGVFLGVGRGEGHWWRGWVAMRAVVVEEACGGGRRGGSREGEVRSVGLWQRGGSLSDMTSPPARSESGRLIRWFTLPSEGGDAYGRWDGRMRAGIGYAGLEVRGEDAEMYAGGKCAAGMIRRARDCWERNGG